MLADLSRYVMVAIEWGLVPLILLALFLYGLTRTPNDPQLRTSTTAGKLAGFILFILFVVSQKGHPLGVSFSLPDYGIEWLPLLLSTAASFAFARVLDWLLGTRLAGLIAMFLIAASLTTVYAYVFLVPYRSTIVYVTLGGSLGVLLEILFFERDRVPAPSSSSKSD